MLPTYRKILYATDLSPIAIHALGHAVALADRFGADITVLHVLPDSLENYSEETGIDLAKLFGEKATDWMNKGDVKKAIRAIHERLEKMMEEHFSNSRTAAELAKTGIRVVCGEPSEQIRKEAREGNFDLIVLGTHGHGKLMRLVLGSVARNTVKNSSIPVLVVPLPEDNYS